MTKDTDKFLVTQKFKSHLYGGTTAKDTNECAFYSEWGYHKFAK